MFDKGQKQSSTLSCDSSYFFFAMSRSPESWSEILTVEIYYKSHSDMDSDILGQNFFIY